VPACARAGHACATIRRVCTGPERALGRAVVHGATVPRSEGESGMKVMYVIPGMGGGGGAERSLSAMAPHWRGRLDVHIVTFSERTALVGPLEEAGVRCTNLGRVPVPRLVRELTEIARADRPDLIHTTLFDADVAGRLAATVARVPISASLVSLAYGPDHRASPQVRSHRMRLAHAADAATARSVSRFHALTQSVATVMGRRLAIDARRIEVIPRGREPEALGDRTDERRQRVRHRLGVGDEPLVIATARHEWQKGLDVLVRAAPELRRRVPGVKILIGGPEGAQTPELVSLIDSLDLRDVITLIGPRDDVPDLMCAADAYCVPSRREGFASILTEAMALGAPTVASDLAPIREVAGPEPWIELVQPDDPGALATGVLEVLEHPAVVRERAVRSRERFTRAYTAEIVAQQMASFFERAAAGSRRRRRG
jgi:glycosyltransferase involved in cell wall biosynthesis